MKHPRYLQNDILDICDNYCANQKLIVRTDDGFTISRKRERQIDIRFVRRLTGNKMKMVSANV